MRKRIVLLVLGMFGVAQAIQIDASGNTALHRLTLAPKEHADSVESLVRNGQDPNVQNKSGQTPLHAAVLKNYLNSAEILLDHGADPNIPDNNGQTPLQAAIMFGSQAMAKLLLQHGAKVEFCEAAALGEVSSLDRMLARDKILVSRRCQNNMLPLEWAIAAKQRSSIDFLLAHGAALDLCAAAMLGRIDALLKAVEHKPELVNSRNERGQTPLACAVSARQVDAASFLLSRGANVNAGHFLQTAVRNRDTAMVRLLLSRGANKDDFVEGVGRPYDLAVRLGDSDLAKLVK